MEINILFVLCCIEHTVVQCFIHTLFSQKKQVLIEVLMGQNWAYPAQGFISQPVSGNRRAPVPVYRTGLTGYRSEPVEFKFKFK